MGAACPVCSECALEVHHPQAQVGLQICPGCRGMFYRRGELDALVGTKVSINEATNVAAMDLEGGVRLTCPGCAQTPMESRELRADPSTQLWLCRSCGGTWMGDGAFPKLVADVKERQPRRPQPPPKAPPTPALSMQSTRIDELAFSRLDFDEGWSNLLALPIALLLGGLFASTGLGGLLSSLLGMPFHELGHALVSWLTSRFAIPLPFFTIWRLEQSFVVGLIVASAFAALIFFSAREKRWFGVGLGIALLLAQLILSVFVSEWRTMRWQILGGALGEIVLSALLLVAFYFPLPDRLRWDFWRWVFLVPAATVLWRSRSLWRTVAADVSQMPWGSAIGQDSDGDMNRLVEEFGLRANDIAAFYVNAVHLCLFALLIAYLYGAWRAWLRKQQTERSAPTAGG